MEKENISSSSQPLIILSGKRKSLEEATKMASQVALLSPTSLVECKSLIHKARLSSKPFEEELEPFVNLFDSKDQKEGVEAFLEKRKPKWQNE